MKEGEEAPREGKRAAKGDDENGFFQHAVALLFHINSFHRRIAREEHYQYQLPPVMRKLSKVLITFLNYLQFSCLLTAALLLVPCPWASATAKAQPTGSTEDEDDDEKVWLAVLVTVTKCGKAANKPDTL